MPTYQYACTECGHSFETVQSFSEDSLTVCPVCSGRLRKVFNAVGVVFKGSGFYRNDSRSAAASGGGESATSGGDAKKASGTGSSSSGGGSASKGGDAGSSSSGSSASSSGSSGSSGSSSPAASTGD